MPLIICVRWVCNWRCNWREVWTLRCAAVAMAGAASAELLSPVTDNTGLRSQLTNGHSLGIQLAWLRIVVVLRPIQLKSLAPKDAP